MMFMQSKYVPGEKIEGAVFTSGDFYGGSFINEVVFDHCIFDAITLKEETFNQCTFNHCTFLATCIFDSQFYDCEFQETNLSEGIWVDVLFGDSNFKECLFNEMMTLTNVEIKQGCLDKCMWSDTINNKDNIIFSKCSIIKTSFIDYLLTGFDFIKCTFSVVNFDKSEINKSEFVECFFSWCNFNKCDLHNMIFEHVVFKNSKFKKCDFNKETKMRNVSITDTKFLDCKIPTDIICNISVEPTTSVSTSTEMATLEGKDFTIKIPTTTKTLPSKPIEPQIGKLRAFRFITCGI